MLGKLSPKGVRGSTHALFIGCVLLVLPAGVSRAGNHSVRIDELADASDVVLDAECETVEPHWDAEHRVIVTDAHLRVHSMWKGDAKGDTILRTLGGKVGAVSMGASHAAMVRPGVRSVFFLRRSSFGEYFVLTRGSDGILAEPGSTERNLIEQRVRTRATTPAR